MAGEEQTYEPFSQKSRRNIRRLRLSRRGKAQAFSLYLSLSSFSARPLKLHPEVKCTRKSHENAIRNLSLRMASAEGKQRRAKKAKFLGFSRGFSWEFQISGNCVILDPAILLVGRSRPKTQIY